MNLKLSIKTFGFLSILFLFSSCMMMAPSHLTGHKNNMDNNSTMQTDLVCGHSFENISDAAFVYQYDGNTYYFHSEQCLNDFKQSPDRFINNYSDHHKHGIGNGMMWGLGAIGMAAMMVIMFL